MRLLGRVIVGAVSQPQPTPWSQRQAFLLAVPATRRTPPALGGLAAAADGGLCVQCAIRQWQVVVICPSSQLNFGDPTPVQEFVERRVVWIELLSERLPPAAPPLQRALGMLLLPEAQLPACSALIRAEAAGTSLGTEIDDVIAAILVSRSSGRTVPEICAMGGITVEDFSSSVAYPKSLGWAAKRAVKRAGRRAGKKAARPKPPLSPCACFNAAAARSTPANKPAFRPYPSAPLKP